MSFKNENRHMVDILFVLALFCVFTISALLLVILGADIYRKTVQDMDQNFTARTSFAYVTEKIRQSDSYHSVEVGTFSGEEALILTQSIDSVEYSTYIYLYDGHLKELFTKKGQSISPKAGQNILALNSFGVEQVNSNLYRLIMVAPNHTSFSMLVSTHSP